MRYHCVQCDREFELAEGEDKPRCPQCLRQHGLRPVERASGKAGKPRSRAGLGGAIAAGLLLIGAGGYIGWSRMQDASRAPSAEADPESLRAAAGLDLGDAAGLLEADDAIEAFAKRATDGKDSDDAKASAIAQAIAARAKALAFVPSPLHEPREAPAMTAAQTLQAIAKDGGRRELYPLEVAALAVAALRSVDVEAQVFEVYAFSGERAPLDPSGRLGYYAAGLAPAKPGEALRVYDVFGGRPKAAAPPDAVALTDMQAIGGFLAMRALAMVAHAGDPGNALRFADAANKLAPSSAAVRGVRAAVLLASGGRAEGSRELEVAQQLLGAPPQSNNLAMLALATGDVDRAAKLVAQALSAAPDYAAAHLTLASVHMARHERDLARAELGQAERLDSRLPALPLAWAELHASEGDFVQARLKAEEGVRRRPKSPETHLLLARVHRQAGNYDAMRQEARKVLELAPATQKDEITQVLKAVLGPTALQPDPAAEDEPAAAPTPTLEPGNLQLGAGEPKLRLGDSKLKLDLTH